ncbi:MAG: 3-isopropylmalate dehydratase small subunit [Marinovum sp.]|jgi:3-isopropylmalate/(R)-2-methylmalate dehydratase small subunit|nr:3-isopropylmalate dehydratase small subunit [Marinovum sp.]|tara:strand:- start:1253 stop:1858 length:606 start_codon:yes stop_codon:yes gene_type:complete
MTKIITGIGAPLPLANVDTDVIMPKRFLVTITREGLADGTFADLRFDNMGNQRSDFVLNKEPWKKATILIVGDNFGCGSSREHAVWGMRQLKIEACIGTSFAGIFYDNARKNGLALPIVSEEVRDSLLQFSSNTNGAEISIELSRRIIIAGDLSANFEMDDATLTSLIRGRDDTLDSLEYTDQISAFEAGLDDKMRVRVIK